MPDADEAKIKAAYRKQARKWHPDVNDNSSESISKFKEITEAYEVLTDTQRRSQYDILKGFNTRKESASTNKSQSQSQAQAKRAYAESKKTTTQKTNVKDFSNKSNTNEKFSNDKGSFSQVFENILDGLFTSSDNKHKQSNSSASNNKTKKLKPENGRDINLNITIKMSEAISGTHRTVNVLHTEKCPKCEGRRFINGSKCPICKGVGEVSSHKKINVKIPAGIKKGAKIRVSNEGNKGYNGGKNGDLYLLIDITDDKFFKYDENNVICEIPITPFEAVLGANIDVPTICGTVSMKIPPNTTSGQKFRLSGQGLLDAKTKKKGDQLVVVKIEIPKELSQEEINLYEKLKALSKHNIRENLLNE